MQKNYKKYALIGTSCVGKTTLLQELERELKKNFPRRKTVTVPEAARLYFGAYKTKNPFSYNSQRNVQKLAHQLELYAQSLLPSYILTDRSVLDAGVYLHAMGDKAGSKKLLYGVRELIESYDYVFILDPKGVPYKTDGVRKETSTTRNRFHQSFLALVPQYTNRWKIISGTPKKRLQQMLKVIYTSTH